MLDPTALDSLTKLIGGDRRLLGPLIESFLEVAPNLQAEVRAGTLAGDGKRLQTAAHTIKSSARDFGAVRLADLCQELEKLGRDGGIARARELLSTFETEHELALAALAGELALLAVRKVG
ncbi:MAG: Hpt domain-containing protein [Geminicoccaceae bacterium]